MNRFFSLFILSLLLLPLGASAQRLVILHTNDMHSRLNGYGPESAYTPEVEGDDETLGGFARLAALIEREREAANGTELLVDAGDFLMGSLFHTLEEETGFQINLMGEMGYDAVAIGNHEFDFGPASLAQTLLKATEIGVIPNFVLTNISFSEDPGDDQLETLYGVGKAISPYRIIERNGLRIGVFSLLGDDAQYVAPMAMPVEFSKPLKTARKTAKMLREDKGVDVVICLSHSGVRKQKDGSWGGEDAELAEKVPEIDVIVSGHTHTHLFKPVLINGTPIVQAGAYASFLGRLELNVVNGEVEVIAYKLLPVNDEILGNGDYIERISEHQRLISEQVLNPMELTYDQVVAETAFPLVLREDSTIAYSNLGALVADATYAYVNENTDEGTDVTFFAAGMVRDQVKPGQQSTADVFRTLSLGEGMDGFPGFPLAKVYVTGKEMKGILEVLYLIPTMSKSNYVYLGGMTVTYDEKKGFLRKIQSAEISDEEGNTVLIDFSKKNKQLYSITADTYLLEFMGLIKKTTKGLVNVKLKDAQGYPVKDVSAHIININPRHDISSEAKEWLALYWYLSTFDDVNGNGIPDVPETYKAVIPAMRSVHTQYKPEKVSPDH